MRNKLKICFIVVALLAVCVGLLAACNGGKEEYTVTFDMNYSQPASETPPQKVKEGGQAEKPKEEPERPDYKFTGWYKDADASEPFDFANERIYGPTVIYAGWMQMKYHIAGSFTEYEPKKEGYNLLDIKERPGWLGITVELTDQNKDTQYGGHFYKITDGTWSEEGTFGAAAYELQPPPENKIGAPKDAIYIADNSKLSVLFDTVGKKIYDDSMKKDFDTPRIYGDFNEAMGRGKNWSMFSGEALELIDDDGDGIYEASYEFPAYTGKGEGYAMLTAVSQKYKIEPKVSYWTVDKQYKFDGTVPEMNELSILKPTASTIYQFSYDSSTNITEAKEHITKLDAPTVYGDFSDWSAKGSGAVTLTDPDGDGTYTGFKKFAAYTGSGDGYRINIALSLINLGGNKAVYEQYKFDGAEGSQSDTSYLKPAKETIYEFSYDSVTKTTLTAECEPGAIVMLEAPTLCGDFNDWVFEGKKALKMDFDEQSGTYFTTVIIPKYEGEGKGYIVLTAISKKLIEDASGIRWGLHEKYKLDGKPATTGDVSFIKTSTETVFLAVYDPTTHVTELIKQ